MPSPTELRTEADRIERQDRIENAAQEIAFGLADLIRSITKGDGGKEFADKSEHRIADGIVDLVKVVTNA